MSKPTTCSKILMFIGIYIGSEVKNILKRKEVKRMSKRKVIFALLFIASISLLNVAVLIEASNQEDQLVIDAFNQQPIIAGTVNYPKRNCDAVKRCSIVDRHDDCYEINGYCD